MNLTRLTLMVAIGALPSIAFAQSPGYNLMAPLGPLAGSVNLTQYLQGVFQVTIGVAGVLAVVMIVWCGIKLMGTPSVSEKSEAKKCITNALIGLLLAISSWVILNTINSQLILSEMNIGNTATLPTIGATPPGANDPMPTAPGWYYRKNVGGVIKNSERYNTSEECLQVMQKRKDSGDTVVLTPSGSGSVECFEIRPIAVGAGETSVRNALCGNNSCVGSRPIGIKQAPCQPANLNGVVNRCINVAGMPGAVVSHIQSLQSSCGCDIVITGGTENGHRTHQPGNRVFDLRITPTLDSFIKSNGTGPRPSFGGWQRWQWNGYWYTYEGDHWHVCANGDPQSYCN